MSDELNDEPIGDDADTKGDGQDDGQAQIDDENDENEVSI